MERDSSGGGTAAEGFDAVLERLRGVVERLETGSLTLEESLRVFEDGVRLSRRGTQILESAEKRVEILLQGEEGAPATVAFADDGPEKPGDQPGTASRRRDG